MPNRTSVRYITSEDTAKSRTRPRKLRDVCAPRHTSTALAGGREHWLICCGRPEGNTVSNLVWYGSATITMRLLFLFARTQHVFTAHCWIATGTLRPTAIDEAPFDSSHQHDFACKLRPLRFPYNLLAGFTWTRTVSTILLPRYHPHHFLDYGLWAIPLPGRILDFQRLIKSTRRLPCTCQRMIDDDRIKRS